MFSMNEVVVVYLPAVSKLEIRRAKADDHPRMDEIREAAFAPIFASFRSLLGDEIYQLAQARGDNAQGDLLASMFAGSEWELYAAEHDGELVGFMAIKFDHETKVGEIGLNAVDPRHARQGFGTTMYEFANARMKDMGMKVATVSTGGDPSHAAARRAYQKAGFDVFIPSVWMCCKL